MIEQMRFGSVCRVRWLCGRRDLAEKPGMTNVPVARHNTAQDNGLVQPWEGRIFINAPVDVVIVAIPTGNI